MKMVAFVGKNIDIKNYTKEAESFFAGKLTFDNPEYYKKVNSGRWVGDTPKKIVLYERHGHDLILPFGMLPLVFKNQSMFYTINSLFKDDGVRYDYGSSIKPYDYQEEAIEKALKAKQGIIVAPCGAGKTQIGLEVAARLGRKTLWLTHTTDLLNQSLERAKNCFNLKPDDYGTITAGKINIGNVITFATVQTMNKIDLNSVVNEWDVVIVDECHHAVGTPTRLMMFYHVVSNLKARYKFGLTATPKRSDGLSPCMFALLGTKICEIEKDAVKETTCPVKVRIKRTLYMPDVEKILMPDGTISYPKFMDDITNNDERNGIIIDDILNASGTCLVLTDRLTHIDILKKKLEDAGVKCIGLSSSQSKKAKQDREIAISALNGKYIKVLLATFALAKEGLDVPTLDNLFLATPQKNETVVMQSVGRVARKAEGKSFGCVYDYKDTFGMLVSWQKKRINLYKNSNFEIAEE